MSFAVIANGGGGFGISLVLPVAVLEPSENIAASAATSTTARLSAPAGKTTGDFFAGKISDDTNPITLDLGENKYTEIEWCIKFLSGKGNNVYEFRVVADDTPLSTYSVTPQITIVPKIVLAPSENIAAAAATATTARLVAPSGKTTGDFFAGKISDDTNPVTVDIGADKYTEIEWCVKLTGSAKLAEVYEFRVVADSIALDTYTVTPQLTVAEGSPSTVFAVFTYYYRNLLQI